MIWWFLILGVSTLVVVCVAIALYMRLRRHLQAAHAAGKEVPAKRSARVSRATLSDDAPLEDLETFHGKTGNSNIKHSAGTIF